MSKSLAIDDEAPNFALPDQNGELFHLADHQGKKVVLSFHPLAFTGVCALQMQDLEAHREAFAARNAVAVGISVDSKYAKKAWAEQLGISHTPLLADFWPHGEVAALYGIFREDDGISERAVFIVDEDGRIAWKKIYPISERPDIQEIIAALG